MEPCDHGLELEADIHPLLRPLGRARAVSPKTKVNAIEIGQSCRPIYGAGGGPPPYLMAGVSVPTVAASSWPVPTSGLARS